MKALLMIIYHYSMKNGMMPLQSCLLPAMKKCKTFVDTYQSLSCSMLNHCDYIMKALLCRT